MIANNADLGQSSHETVGVGVPERHLRAASGRLLWRRQLQTESFALAHDLVDEQVRQDQGL